MLKKSIYFSLLCLICINIVGCNLNKDEKSDILDKNKSESSTEASTTPPPIEKVDASNLDNTSISWFFTPNDEHKIPGVNNNLSFKLDDYDAIYTGPTSKDCKTLYLTFDEGYENGYTSKILDVLKEKKVQAVFFVTLPYIEDNPDLIKRMVDEGHVVGNHSNHHPAMPDKSSDVTAFDTEFTDVEDKYKELTGKEMVKLFRPPMGVYSEKSLAMTKNLGYKSVFWSFAYYDWDQEKQPDPVQAKEKIMNHLHDGSILLLHAVSETNTNILGDVIDNARDLGYKFELLK